MDRYAFMADLVTLAADCIGNQDCPYEVFVSNGEPPAECGHIAAFWEGSSLTAQSDKCRIVVRENFKVSFNRCCLKNTGEKFDSVAEDSDAQCFLAEFGDLFECLVCEINTVLKQYVRTCQNVTVRVARPDHEPRFGCYGGMIDISFERHKGCCPPVVS